MHEAAAKRIDIAGKGRVLQVTLSNRPDNRITPDMVAGLADAVAQLESDEFDLLLITGIERVFSKGFDVDSLRAHGGPAELWEELTLSNAVFSRVARSTKPTVAAVNGACLGGGFELALACHFRLVAEKTRLGLPEIWIHLVPGLGGFYRLAQLVGRAKALEMVALGDLITADDALRLNVVNRVFPRGDFAARVDAFVNNLLGLDQRALREVIRLVACGAPPGEEDNVRQGMESFARLVPWLQKPQT